MKSIGKFEGVKVSEQSQHKSFNQGSCMEIHSKDSVIISGTAKKIEKTSSKPKEKKVFPLLKLLEKRAVLETPQMIDEGKLEEGEKATVEDVIYWEKEEVSIGWGAYGTPSGHPEMPKNVTVSKEDYNKVSKILDSEEEFTTAVIASLIQTTCDDWLKMSISEAIKSVDKKQTSTSSHSQKPNKAEKKSVKPHGNSHRTVYTDFDSGEIFRDINMQSGGNI